MSARPVICLMGPTASGKTDIAVRLCEHLGTEVISVDSALVYRGMDIGTAKPDAATLAAAPHRLIDIRDPEQSYSAGNFVADARGEIDRAHAAGRVALLVGGTMLYFRSLIGGLAGLPKADGSVRRRLNDAAAINGWPHLHARLAAVDPKAAARIHVNDSQRIQRALEVYEISGRTLSSWHDDEMPASPDYRFIKIALIPKDRSLLHSRIERRLESMLERGFVKEVRKLMRRSGLTAGSASMRAVGYRQIWSYLEGKTDRETARHKALIATRQLAKRQMTWLRAERNLSVFDPLEGDSYDAISAIVTKQMDE